MTDPIIAVSTYRRANGSQASVARARVVRAPKVFPRAHTPSQEARQLANSARTRLGLSEQESRRYASTTIAIALHG